MQIRKDIIWLAQNTSKPLFVIGKMLPVVNPKLPRITFCDIRPYAWKCKTKFICDHINFTREEVEQFVNINVDNFNKEFFLCVKPYIYNDKNGNEKGGLKIDTSLIKDGIFPASMKKRYLTSIDQSLYLNFRNIRNGYYILKEYDDETNRPKPHKYRTKEQQQTIQKNLESYEYRKQNNIIDPKIDCKKVNVEALKTKTRMKRARNRISKKQLKEMRNKILWKTMAEADKEKNKQT